LGVPYYGLLKGSGQNVRDTSWRTDAYNSAAARSLCYKLYMPKSNEQWLLFEYVDGKLTQVAKPFSSKSQAEAARQKYPERIQKKIGLGRIAK
jgi:hypothetical protein